MGLVGQRRQKGAAIRLDNDVKRSIIKFLEQIRTDTIDGNWFSFLTENGLALDEVPYGTKARSEQLYAHFVVQWHSVTERLAEHDKQEDAMRKVLELMQILRDRISLPKRIQLMQ